MMIIWGVPGTGKSSFCRWLAKERGFVHVETDVGGDVARALALARQGRPVVIEWGMFVQSDTIDQVRQWQSAGAQPWWFDGDREAAYQAWRLANAYPDELWTTVLDVIRNRWHLVEEFFGADRILRTVEAGPNFVPPETIFANMQAITR